MCLEAIAALALNPITLPQPTEDLLIPLPTMKEHYKTAVKVWLVGKRLGRTTLEQACKLPLEMVNFAASFKFHKRLRFTVTDDDILNTMGRHILNIKSWCMSLGDTKNTPTLELLQERIRAATSGDQVEAAWFQ